MLIQRIQNFIQQHSLIDPGDTVAVAFSGGPDSIGLLLILRELFLNTSAVYVNHNLRSDSSEEEKFVRKFCSEQSIELYVEQISWKKKPSGLEEAARKRRFRHLEKVANQHGFTKIALAHHQDDLVETMLFRLLRGTGPRGLPGMQPSRGKYVRPLLSVSRNEILQFLNERSITPYQDPTNENLQFARNRIRNELIPYLESEFNPKVRSTLSKTASWFQEQNALLEELMGPYFDQIMIENNQVSIDLKVFLSNPPGIQKELIRRALLKADSAFRMSSNTIQNILTTIDRRKILELPGFLMVQCSPERIHFLRKRGQAGLLEIDVTGAGSYLFPPANSSLNFSIVENKRLNFSADTAFVDAEKAGFPLSIRNWKKGDAFHPFGMSGHKKLSDFWIDRKVPRSQRKQIPLVYKDDHLVWIAGYEIDDDFKVTSKTNKVLKIQSSPVEKK